MIKTPNTLKLFGFLLGAVVLSNSGLARAADPFPTKEIRLIVPWNVGGSNDISARLLSQLIAEQGIKVVVENIAGATGAIGMGKVASAEPDGYTVGMGTG